MFCVLALKRGKPQKVVEDNGILTLSGIKKTTVLIL